MNENNFQRLALIGDAKYKDIEAIEFTPVKEVKMTKVAEKGQRKFWKWLGIIHISERDSWFLSCKSSTIDEIKQRIENNFRHYFFSKDNKLFEQAEVGIKYYNPHRNYEYKYFNSNHQAMDYFNLVKSKCEEVGNELK